MPTPDELLHLDDLLTDEERGWRDRAREFARTRILPTIDDDFEAKHFRAGLVAELGAAGFLGMHLEGYGAAGAGAAGAGAVSYGLACLEFEAVDSGWRTFLSVQGSLTMTAISLFGSEEQKQRWLPAMAAGGAVGCFALTEAASGSDPAGMATTAVRDGDGWVLSGHKRWIGLASIADIAVVWARTDDGVRGFLVETGLPGFTATPIDTKLSMRASIQCDVVLAGVRVPADAVLPGSTGLGSAFSCLNKARFGIAWGVMGAARTCLEAAIGRSLVRESFGRPIGQTQLVQQKLAEMFVSYERGMLLALHLGRLEERHALDPVQLSVAKLDNVRQAISVASLARGILAGDGVTSEFPVMRHLANLESVRTYEGTDEIHTLVIGRALTGLSAF